MARKCINKFNNFSRPGPQDEGTIDVLKAGRWQRERIVRHLARMVEEFYEDPENEKKFREWQKKRTAEAKGTAPAAL